MCADIRSLDGELPIQSSREKALESRDQYQGSREALDRIAELVGSPRRSSLCPFCNRSQQPSVSPPFPVAASHNQSIFRPSRYKKWGLVT
jgi:hypothetical protein